jgi:DNA replicative helicase MCM subunit Mcm2 (Cdc46/Mcm family)
MRIIKGGLILRHVKNRDFIVKDESMGKNGIQLKKIPVNLTKAFLRQILDAENIKHTKYETKKSMIEKIRAVQGANLPLGTKM